MGSKRILIADDHQLFRRGLVNIVTEQPDLQVVGEANDGFEAFQLTRQLRPDLVVMDIRMPVSDGIEGTRLIRSKFPTVRILMLTVQEDNESLFEAIKAGASGYVLKNTSSAEFVEAIRMVLAGDAVVPPRLAANLFREFARVSSRSPSPSDAGTEYDLTEREEEVLGLMAAKYSNDEIAEQLVISINTVKTHVRNILKKLHASDRQEASEIALQQGLLPNPRPGSQSPED